VTNRPRISFYAAPDIERWLNQQAARAGVSVCELVKRIIERAAEEAKK
jgi:predicted HicB family RNase H-like nuclease